MRENEQDSPQEIFQSIVDSQRDRLGRLVRVYAPTETEDLAQEILMQIWLALPSYNGSAKLSTWCYRIGLNTAISWRRSHLRQKRKPPPNRVDSESLASPDLFTNEAMLLARFLNTLSEMDRAVLLMYLEDLTYDEIAESMGVSNGAIRVRISRIRYRLETWEAEDE